MSRINPELKNPDRASHSGRPDPVLRREPDQEDEEDEEDDEDNGKENDDEDDSDEGYSE